MKCKVCNEELNPTWTECPYCETTVEKDLVCKECGDNILPHWRKCPSCKARTEFWENNPSINFKNAHQISNIRAFDNQSKNNGIITTYITKPPISNNKLTDQLIDNKSNTNLYLTGQIANSDEFTFKAIPAIGDKGSLVSLLVNECFKTPIENRLSSINNYRKEIIDNANITEIESVNSDEAEAHIYSNDTSKLSKLELKDGQELVQQFRIKNKIGGGGFANVYKARHIALEEDIAIKAMNSFGSIDSVLSFLVKEYKTQLKIADRKHILRSEAPIKFQQNGIDWVILPMELAEKNFRQWLNENNLEKETRLKVGIDIIRQVCEGIDAIHNAELIHMDIKPENILLQQDENSESWNVKISDFGLTRSLDKLSGTNLEIFQDGVGTPAYMSPEQISAARWKDVTKSADIYAIGTMIYELLDGDLPYSGTSRQIKEKKYDKDISISKPSGSSNYAEVAMKCLSRNVKDRPKSGKEIIDWLFQDKVKNYNNDSSQKKIFNHSFGLKKSSEEIKDILGNRIDEHIYIPEMIDVGNFNIGKFPITFEQYDFYCTQTGAQKPNDDGWGRKDRPVININWYEAAKYCSWINSITGRSFRLPGDHEWELAANAGQKLSKLKYSGSDNLNEVGWFKENSRNMTQPVGRKKPNNLKIHDMTGNVWEWCDEWYDNDKTLKTIRGGSWSSFTNFCSIKLRYWNRPENRLNMVSFRVIEDTQWCF
ncbi:MAG: SUMF1/EgtB/PvdO family nonheme iron enzyme [Melioribacteraceae bacterium]|nr:SUMF1/EgtB/PvdO family nonheme iron enzyme [Melioribacteraceae bacterium]